MVTSKDCYFTSTPFYLPHLRLCLAFGETLVILALRTHKAKDRRGGGDVQKPPLFSLVK
jgi:hypothetical protein